MAPMHALLCAHWGAVPSPPPPHQVVDRMGELVGALPCASDSTAPTLTATGLVDALLDHKQVRTHICCKGPPQS